MVGVLMGDDGRAVLHSVVDVAKIVGYHVEARSSLASILATLLNSNKRL